MTHPTLTQWAKCIGIPSASAQCWARSILGLLLTTTSIAGIWAAILKL